MAKQRQDSREQTRPEDSHVRATLDLLSGAADVEAVRLLAEHGFLAVSAPHEIAAAATRLRADRRASERTSHELVKRMEQIEWTEPQRRWVLDQRTSKRANKPR